MIYNYIVDKIYNYIRRKEKTVSEKYYLSLDYEYQVDQLYDAFKNKSFSQTIKLKSKKIVDHYQTVMVNTPKNKLIIAAALENKISKDFLLTLRNIIGKRIYYDFSILFIYCGDLDSLQRGAISLMDSDMPFNVQNIKVNLENEINNKVRKNIDKEIINYHLEKIIDDYNVSDSSLFDFENVLTIIQKGEIHDHEYKSFRLFPYRNFDEFSKEIKKDLRDNEKLFNDVLRAHNNRDTDYIKENFVGNVKQKLLKDSTWSLVSYNDLRKSFDAAQEKSKIKYIDLTNDTYQRKTNENVMMWDYPMKETTVGRRTRNIIIFNAKSVPNISFNLKFNNNLNKDFLKKGFEIVEVVGKQLKVLIKKSDDMYQKIEYVHNNKNSSRFIIKIIILPLLYEEIPFLNFEAQLCCVNENGYKIPMIETRDLESILIGNVTNPIKKSKIVNPDNNYFDLDINDYRHEITFSYNQLEDYVEMSFNVNYKKFNVKVIFENDKYKKSFDTADVFSQKLQHGESFVLKRNNVLTRGMNEYDITSKDLRYMLDVEKKIIDVKAQFVKIVDGKRDSISLRVDKDLLEMYNQICAYFNEQDLIPLLANWEGDFLILIDKYIKKFFQIIESLQEGDLIEDDYKDLLYLGAVEEGSKIWFTSLNILNLLYQYELVMNYRGNIFKSRLVDLINPNSLLPYFYYNKKLYKRVNSIEKAGWIEYDSNASVKSITSKYLRKAIKEKINQYVTHFHHYFEVRLISFLNINIVEMNNLNQVALGIIDYIIEKIKNDKINKTPILKINVYSKSIIKKNFFDLLNVIGDIEELEEKLNYQFKVNNYDKNDVINMIRNHIQLYYINGETSLDFCNICFTEMKSELEMVDSQHNQIDTGVFLNGLVSDVSITRIKGHYQSGFATRSLDTNSVVIKNIIALNEYARNSKGDFKSSYKRNESIVLDIYDKNNYLDIFESSDWVTFISPDVDLEFFSQLSDSSYILHYNDQYTNYVSYDAITMTKNINQYGCILNYFLNENSNKVSDEKIETIIDSFSAINGEWLLKIFNSDKKIIREKIGIISAVKHLLVYLDNPNFLWIPVSLEEILRVTGAVGLSGNNGIFSVKELDINGSKSDDILLIGICKQDERSVLYFVPVEVKIGQNSNSYIAKAKEQIKNTSEMFQEYLHKKNTETTLQRKVLTHFFVQLGISAYKKMKTFGFLSDKNELFNDCLKDLVNGEYCLKNLDTFGNGIIFSFKDECTTPSFNRTEDEFIIEMNSDIAYTDLGKSMDDVTARYTDLKINEMYTKEVECDKKTGESKNCISISDKFTGDDLKEPKLIAETNSNYSVNIKIINSMDNRFLLGVDNKFGENKYWEFFHKNLQNRHLLLTGSSGSGKTYALQTLLYEASKSNIPAVIFDYTNGFNRDQLVTEFKEMVDNKLEYHLIIRDKLGINPFERFPMIIAGELIEEQAFQVAQRIAATFKSVYGFKEQQFSAIYEAIRNGINEWDNSFDLNKMIENLHVSENKSAQTVISKIIPFIDSDIFDLSSDLSWKSIQESGNIHIFQLTGFNREIQKLITELVLWDFWNFMVLNGSESSPFIVVLDEAQNINHSESSPSGKILTEGRKFGISGWYATQFLKNAVTNDEIQRLQQSSQKLYFRPADSGLDEIASYLSADKTEIQQWKSTLLGLKKGECITVGYAQELTSLNRYRPQKIKITSFEDRKFMNI